MVRTSRPSVLLVAPTYSHPGDQGNAARIQAFGLALMARNIEVDYLYYALDHYSEEREIAMRQCWRNYYYLPGHPHAPISQAASWGLDDWCPDALVDKVAQLHRQNQYDAVIVNYVWLSKVFEGLSSTLKILDTHDLFGDRHRVATKAGILPNWYFTSIEEEGRGFDRADYVIGIQSDELEEIGRRTQSRRLLVSHPVRPEQTHMTALKSELSEFGYIASANPWNQKSVLDLDKEMSRVGLDWLLAGRICDVDLRLKSEPFLLGKVNHVSEFYASTGCSLNPMVEATGLKIKTIEALSYDQPIIGTRAAFAGLDAEHDFHRCESTADVADAALEYTQNASLKSDLRCAGRKLFYRYLEQVQGQYDALADVIRNAASKVSKDYHDTQTV